MIISKKNGKKGEKMAKKVNIIYDFDGTLTKTPIPKYSILEKCGYENGTLNENFLKEFMQLKEKNNCSVETAFYELLFQILKRQKRRYKLKDFLYGSNKIVFCDGLSNYFNNINNFAQQNDIVLSHFVLTSGLKNFVEASRYSKFFTKVYGCELDVQDNYVDGVSFLLGNKEKIKVLTELQNDKNTKADFTIYIGDGLTDIYAMDFNHKNGGINILVRQSKNDDSVYQELNKNGIVDFYEISNFGKRSKLFNTICKIIKS